MFFFSSRFHPLPVFTFCFICFILDIYLSALLCFYVFFENISLPSRMTETARNSGLAVGVSGISC